eukprot:Protomagalhaensia_wolfi_Nauph_80__580@NODE_1329_length_1587_cov_24_114341_g1027_i0_p1_GENE_NODE_1329_length_1587_cov_24_114341_g1027_i0NODE_1329_length_1587_cov_24_114341_g1027_i0_p1_ORF_typecomplete_len259_score43_36_NODE_1329_length_1587_cov_24_114341_g1027_i06781454
MATIFAKRYKELKPSQKFESLVLPYILGKMTCKREGYKYVRPCAELVDHFWNHWDEIKDQTWTRNACGRLFGGAMIGTIKWDETTRLRDAVGCAYAVMETAQTSDVWRAALKKKLQGKRFPYHPSTDFEVSKTTILEFFRDTKRRKVSKRTPQLSGINSPMERLVSRLCANNLSLEEQLVICVFAKGRRQPRFRNKDLGLCGPLQYGCEALLELRNLEGIKTDDPEPAPLYLLRELLQQTRKKFGPSDMETETEVLTT